MNWIPDDGPSAIRPGICGMLNFEKVSVALPDNRFDVQIFYTTRAKSTKFA